MATPPASGWPKAHDDLAQEAGFEDWASWVAVREKKIGFAICGAKTRGKDEEGRRPCGKAAGAGLGPEVDYGPCTWHGGAGAHTAGPAHGNYKDGRHSKAMYRLRGSLGETYKAAQDDIEDAFDLALHARVLQARIIDIVNNLPESPVTPTTLGAVSAELDEVAARLLRAIKAGNEKRTKAATVALREKLVTVREHVLADARLEADAWESWGDLVEKMRALAQTEGLRDQRKYGPVTWGDVLVVVERVRTGVLRFVPEENAGDVLKYFRRLASPPAGTGLTN